MDIYQSTYSKSERQNKEPITDQSKMISEDNNILNHEDHPFISLGEMFLKYSNENGPGYTGQVFFDTSRTTESQFAEKVTDYLVQNKLIKYILRDSFLESTPSKVGRIFMALSLKIPPMLSTLMQTREESSEEECTVIDKKNKKHKKTRNTK